MTTSKSRYLFPLLIGLGIIFGTVVVYLQIHEYEKQLSQSYKNEISRIFEEIIDRREGRLQTISNSIIGFFEGSKEVTPYEFEVFSTRLFDANSELVNISILDDNKTILYSTPHSEMIGKNFDVLFPSHPTQINGINTMNLEFNMSDLRKIIVSVPFDYFISSDTIPSQTFKLILSSPLDNDLRLYEIFVNNGVINTSNVEFSEKELKNSIDVNVKTELYGHTIKKEYVLKYLIWTEIFEPNNTFANLFLIIGVIASGIIPIMIYISNSVLSKKNTELEQIKKSKDEFVTMIIHDLKNPLVPILSVSDILLSNMLGDLNSKQVDRIKMIKSSAMSLQNLIQDLLDSQKAELGKLHLNLSKNNLSEILQNTLNKFKMDMDKKEILVETNIVNDVSCICDKIRIEQVISNLLLNSLDFVSEKIGKISVSLESNNHTAKITIRDNGLGIEKDQLDKLFVKFYQIKNNTIRHYGGSGLGLAVSNEIVALHGGKIWAESDGIGKGSTFFIELPLKE
ncbi:HAMP domain-containing sensor histidine kinase [Nitrosarchaeum sp.]|uniref:sensor histidine kinase n=1 Tax=Nitrosarchaeum sp. TaxID=2026886 RepID=UPI00247C2D78|nr:HAMP domain-containing sensor histidine kinase [Nitrosarchaeum sp.]MCV0411403.1 HAMP domain-containing histidine kinase [Nitrosarchaeum sp.]